MWWRKIVAKNRGEKSWRKIVAKIVAKIGSREILGLLAKIGSRRSFCSQFPPPCTYKTCKIFHHIHIKTISEAKKLSNF